MCIPHIKRDCRLNDFQSLDFQSLKQQPFFISWLRNSIVSPFANSEQAPYGSLALIISQFTLYLPLYSRTRAIALFRPASHDCSFVNGARKVNVCFAAASFSFALIISYYKYFESFLFWWEEFIKLIIFFKLYDCFNYVNINLIKYLWQI